MARKNLLKGFKKPSGLSFEQKDLTQNYGKFEAYPFERGFGTTIGNTMRRVLLSSIQGFAVVAVRFTSRDADGKPHVISSEFDSIPGVVEDTPEIISNLKSLCVALTNEDEDRTIILENKSGCVITGKDFEVDSNIKIMNPDLKIATIMKDANLDMEVQISLGRGYVPAEVNEQYKEVVDAIAVDGIFSPVTKVRYSIEDTRVGDSRNYDKLILEVWTDGTVSPEDAVGEAAKIAKEHFTIFINFDEKVINSEEEKDKTDKHIQEVKNTPVGQLELSVRASNCLNKAKISTLGDLTAKTEEDILKTRNFGKKSLAEIKGKLEEWGLTLGMTEADYANRKIGPKTIQKENKDEA
ncbi:MAG: DNA-directed RNA polymerase subunit alpha [Spirochaetia bacterium]|jgi:DNA-directed RNA polymerase subunit alpha|nr:DNA-directed RNA polymerase subunit alpha [Spirochaetia bacterium]